MNEETARAIIGRLAERIAGLTVENCVLSLKVEELSAVIDQQAAETNG